MNCRPLFQLACAGLATLALSNCARVIGLTENYYIASAEAGRSGSDPVGGAGTSAGSAGKGGDPNAGGGDGGMAGDPGLGGTGAGAGASAAGDGGTGDGPALYVPAGKLVFERYSTYPAGDSKIFVITFPGGQIGSDLGAAYKICSPYNGIFSPDGTHLAVGAVPMPSTGICPGALDRTKLEVFILDLMHPPSVQRVTNNSASDEDPQYSPDGTFILFKHDGYMRRWVVGSTPFNETACKDPKGSFCFKSSGDPQSKPVVSDTGLVCYEQSLTQNDPNGDIYCFNLADGLADKDISSDANRVHAINHNSIYDSRPVIAPPYLYFTRWRVPAAPHVNFIQRTLLSNLQGTDESCAFCTDPGTGYEDAFSLGEGDLVVFSSNANGMGKGDLFIANFSGTFSKALDYFAPGVNTSNDELGAAFWHAPPVLAQ